MDVSEADVYDVILTRAEIQEAVDMINAMVKKEIAAAKREMTDTLFSLNVFILYEHRSSGHYRGKRCHTIRRSATAA